MNQTDYDPKVSELIDGVPTAKDQEGITIEETKGMEYIVYSNHEEAIIRIPETEDETVAEFFVWRSVS